jgi:riboflavin synthase
MFTGLIETIGTIERLSRRGGGLDLRVRCRLPGGSVSVGESVAVDGACLTVTGRGTGWFEVLASPETVRRTTAGAYRIGRKVNIERALSAGARLGGHFVQGHVDGRCRVKSARREGDSRVLRFAMPRGLAPFIVEKGSVALDGVSLTVTGVGRGWFEVMLIPHTLAHSTLSERKTGDETNLEADLIAKYVGSLMKERSRP